MKVNFKGVTTGPKRIGMGVQTTTITDASFGVAKNENKTPYLSVTFKAGTGATHDEKFYLSPKSLPKLKHLMCDGLGYDETQLNRDITEDQLVGMLKGREVRIKFGAREYYDKTKTIRNATELGFDNFAESVKIPEDKTTLHFDEDKDIRKVVVETADEDFGI